jgi:hypothetical protein
VCGAGTTPVNYQRTAYTFGFGSEPTVRAHRADPLGWLRRQLSRENNDVL